MSAGRRTFLSELKRRKVYQVAAAYAGVGVAIAVSTPDLFAAFGLPATAARFVVLLLILGFPIALVLAWAHEVRPEEPAEPAEALRAGSAGATLPPSEPQTAIARATAESLAGLGPLRDDPRPSLAVLPFASFSEDAEADFFGLGFMDTVLTCLTHVWTSPVYGELLIDGGTPVQHNHASLTFEDRSGPAGMSVVPEPGTEARLIGVTKRRREDRGYDLFL